VWNNEGEDGGRKKKCGGRKRRGFTLCHGKKDELKKEATRWVKEERSCCVCRVG